MYVVTKSNAVGLVLNPDAPVTDDFIVSFGPTDVRAVEDDDIKECVVEYSPIRNFLVAHSIAGSVFDPIGQIYGYPTPPYGGGWDGGRSFSRTICSGNYSFGGSVTGDRLPVWIYTPFDKRDLYAGYYAVSDVTISATSSSRGKVEVTIPAGGYWSSRYRGGHRPKVIEVEGGGLQAVLSPPLYVMAAYRRQDKSQGVVDLLGRW